MRLVELQAAVNVANAVHTLEYKGARRPLWWAICRLKELKSESSLIESMATHPRRERVTECSSKWENYQMLADNSLRSSSVYYEMDSRQKSHALADIRNMQPEDAPERFRPTSITHICEIPLREREKLLSDLRKDYKELNGLLEFENHQSFVTL